jgi:hypothetical protein
VYIVAVFEDREFGKFEYDGSFEEFGGKSFVVEVFLVFNSENIKNLSASVTFCRTVTLMNSVIWLIIASDRVNN